MTGQDDEFPFLGPEGFMPIRYRQWGDRGNRDVVICVHGLSRNRLDFDELGEALAGGWRVLAPDMPGRGGSGWLADKTGYGHELYRRVCAALIARSGADRVLWVGTSMGGLIGMSLAAEAATPLGALVMNDIGPHVPAAGRRDNQASFGTDPRFADFEEAVAWHKVNRAGFGPMPEEGWRRMTEASVRRREDGSYGLHYDPGLAVNSKREPVQSTVMWDVWQRIACPVLTIWGTESKLLLADDLERMQAEGPGTEVLPVEGVGHAPAISGDRVVGAIADFLQRHRAG